MPPKLPDFSTLFEQLPIGAYRSSPDGRQLRANAALVRLNGYADEAEMLAAVNDIGSEWYVDPAQRGEFARRMQRDGHVLDFVSEVYRHKTRERIWVRENAHVVRDTRGGVLLYEGTVEDITAERTVRLALEASERRFRALIEKAQVLTLVCDPRGTIRYASPASASLLGRAPETLVGQCVFDFIHPEDLAAARAEFESVLEGVNNGLESSARIAHADGSWRHLAALANDCRSDPAVDGVVLNLRDVTERKRAEEQLQRLADRDELTDLANRRYLMDRLRQAQAYSLTRSGRLCALLYIDLDDFKRVNDTRGHDIGDRLLRMVAERLWNCVRIVDTVSRFGGDEFVILLQDFEADAAVALPQVGFVAHKILTAMREPFDLEGRSHVVTCSIGATLFGEGREPVDEILRRADRRLYEAKAAGRNTVALG
ncbi:MAG TPA: diguanylate cyclase [Burkholderiaceae bacterium]|nr:diguanylate cyclase [Burkholderiaceae bacterium]